MQRANSMRDDLQAAAQAKRANTMQNMSDARKKLKGINQEQAQYKRTYSQMVEKPKFIRKDFNKDKDDGLFGETDFSHLEKKEKKGSLSVFKDKKKKQQEEQKMMDIVSEKDEDNDETIRTDQSMNSLEDDDLRKVVLMTDDNGVQTELDL